MKDLDRELRHGVLPRHMFVHKNRCFRFTGFIPDEAEYSREA